MAVLTINNQYSVPCEFSFEYLHDPKEIRDLILNHFDTNLWECDLEICKIEEWLEDDTSYILFKQEDIVCSLAKLIYNNDDDNVMIDILEVAKSYGRSKGVGEMIVKLLRRYLYCNTYLYGYSLPQSARFWKRVSCEYDKNDYNKIESCDFEGGGIMYFSLS